MNANAICGNCGKPYWRHVPEENLGQLVDYCFKDTTGDVFTDEPSNDLVADMIEERHPELWAQYVAEWKKENGHD